MRYFARGIFLSLYPPICTVSDENPNMKKLSSEENLGCIGEFGEQTFP